MRIWLAAIPQITPVTNIMIVSIMVDPRSENNTHRALLAAGSIESNIGGACSIVFANPEAPLILPGRAHLRGGVAIAYFRAEDNA
jgi:hypothetical protein